VPAGGLAETALVYDLSVAEAFYCCDVWRVPATGAALFVIGPVRSSATRDFSNCGRNTTGGKAHISILIGFLASCSRPSTALLAEMDSRTCTFTRAGGLRVLADGPWPMSLKQESIPLDGLAPPVRREFDAGTPVLLRRDASLVFI
jgi:hypothetical protein